MAYNLELNHFKYSFEVFLSLKASNFNLFPFLQLLFDIVQFGIIYLEILYHFESITLKKRSD